MATAVIEHQIDTTLGAKIVGGGLGQRYPSVQASCYQPKITDKLDLVFGDSSLSLLSDKAKAMMITSTMETAFSDDSEIQTVSVINPAIRWIFIGMPTARFVRSKDTKKVQNLEKGMSFKRDRLESCAKIFLAAVLDEELICDDNGAVQVFSLALNSTKTKLVEDKDPEYRTIRKLNNWLIKKNPKLDPKDFWVHLASVSLIAKPEKMVGADATSIGTMYIINDMPRILPPTIQKDMGMLSNSPEMQILVNDPYLIDEKNRSILTQLQAASDSVVSDSGEVPDEDEQF
jgi:hypothetical protein